MTVDLKEATTMATLLKPNSGDFYKDYKSQARQLENIQKN